MQEEETFSTKKERKSLFRCPPPLPRPPPKSCPPKSRVFRRDSELLRAQAVTFSQGKQLQGTPLHSAAYDGGKAATYFSQAFVKEAEIGAGYFGTVYRVRSREDRKLYAVKVGRERYRGPSDRGRKLEEVRKHELLPPHTNLVTFHGSWEERGRLYQQFELCEGNLEEWVENRGQLSEGTLWGLLADLLQAVGHLHSHDLVHMDIKPENIFIGRDGRAKLGDFGLMIDLTCETGGIEGDPKYLAPEVLQGQFTPACDVFSLGVTMLEVSTDLDLPREGPLWHQLRKQGPEPALTQHLGPQLTRVLRLMMMESAERRPGIKQLLELPSVAQAVSRRGRELLVRSAWEGALHYVAALFSLVSLVLSYLLPSPGPSLPSTPPPHSTTKSTPHSIQAFSDDEDFDSGSKEDSRGSDLASPLPDEADSELNDSTPPPRHRSKCLARTPGVTPGKLFFQSPSPPTGESVSSVLSPGSLRVNRDTSGSSDTESEGEGVVRPRSLALSFDHFSADDED